MTAETAVVTDRGAIAHMASSPRHYLGTLAGMRMPYMVSILGDLALRTTCAQGFSITTHGLSPREPAIAQMSHTRVCSARLLLDCAGTPSAPLSDTLHTRFAHTRAVPEHQISRPLQAVMVRPAVTFRAKSTPEKPTAQVLR